jgi:hypothetical protein
LWKAEPYSVILERFTASMVRKVAAAGGMFTLG